MKNRDRYLGASTRPFGDAAHEFSEGSVRKNNFLRYQYVHTPLMLFPPN